MPKEFVITITIRQLADGGCWIESDPPVAELMQLAETPAKATTAHGYAWVALAAMAEEGGAQLLKPAGH